MAILIATALILTVGLGAYLLVPRSQNRMMSARAKLAVTHGLLGTLGFAGYVWMLSRSYEEASLLVWTAVSLLAIGLGLGIAIYLITRYRPSGSHDLVLMSHVIFAGMGALIILALVLI